MTVLKKILVRANQNIYDICIQEYGSLEFIGKLIDDNNLNFSALITQGQELVIDNATNGNADVKDFFELPNKKVQNGYIFKNDIPAFNFDTTLVTFDEAILTWDLIQLP